MADLLLHSLTNFEELIEGCVAAVKPRRIGEIGSESGAFTERLVEWGEACDATVVSIDPQPAEATRELAARSDRLELVEGYSPDALAGVAPCEVYVIDGDHNYWTVSRELEAVYSGERRPLSILHDVGWPCARRDQYYAPDRLPPDAVHEHSFHDGAVPGRDELAPGTGLSGAGVFGRARQEGGPRNGVLTAVEDFLAAEENAALEYAHVPAVFGLGVIFDGKAPYAAQVRDLLAPYDRQPLLERLERNRVELFSEIVEQQDRIRVMQRRLNGALSELDREQGLAGARDAAAKLAAAQSGDGDGQPGEPPA